MKPIRLVPTHALPGTDLAAIRNLLDAAFDAFDDDDWHHTIGGLHAIARDADDVIGHGSVVGRRMWQDDNALDVGYVEAVAVRADRRRARIGSSVLAALEDEIRRSYDIGALSATGIGAAFYLARGWRQWPGTTSVMTDRGRHRTPADDGIYVLAGLRDLAANGDLAADQRSGDAW
jgi:aminoglycoside 2'-N-acetyltransferase I